MTSRTFAEKLAARAPQKGSSASSAPYSFIAEPQPALFTTMWSMCSVSIWAMRLRIRCNAGRSRPAWISSAPQQLCSGGTSTSHPWAASTRAVARLTCAKNASCTHPVSMATRFIRGPRGVRRRGPRTLRSATRRSGAMSSRRRSAAGTKRCSASRRSARRRPSACVSATADATVRIRRGLGSTANRAARDARDRQDRAKRRSTWGRTCSTRRLYCTPEGQASTHAMQPRHASQWRTTSWSMPTSPRAARSMSRMRPRGESISSPQSR
jgi:hypothetical protein